MDMKDTLKDIDAAADKWHGRLAVWLLGNPKKAATIGMVGGPLAGWKLAELAIWAMGWL